MENIRESCRYCSAEITIAVAAMAAVSNIYRAANTIRNHMERDVLAEEDLSWAAFTVLFVLWIWGDQQTRHLAAEAGVTKGTLTGVLKTLEKRGLARRRGHDSDGRLVLVTGSPGGRTIINTVLCVVVNVIDFEMDLRSAVDAPRLHQQWLPDEVHFEGVKKYPALVKQLQAMGHTIILERQGDAHSIAINPRTGHYLGAADHRLSGKAAGY